MFVELDERELMKHDGGGMLLSAWDLCHAIEKFISKISDEFGRRVDDENNRKIGNNE